MPSRNIDAFLRFMGLTSDATNNTKGNKGRGAAQRRFRFLGLVLVIVVCLLGLVHVLVPESNINSRVMTHAKKLRQVGSNVAAMASHKQTNNNNNMNMNKKQQHHHRDDDHHHHHIHHDDTTAADADDDANDNDNRRKRSHFKKRQIEELIFAGKLHLVDLHSKRSELADAATDSYDGVYGIFCRLNFQVHKDDPSSVPMFRDVVTHSPLCEEEFSGDDFLEEDEEDLPRGRFQFNLRDLAEKSRQADASDRYPNAKNLALSGIAFHESRCGSTLVANSLIAMNPTKHRVYSESAPPIHALGLCTEPGEPDDDEERPCTSEQGVKILQDVIYFMGRSDDPNEERFFFKIQSAGTKSLATFRKAFPHTPWLFVYRDPVQVMMSHFAHGIKTANCLRALRNPPIILQSLARKRGYRAAAAGGGRRVHHDDERKDSELKELTPQEFCAAHLATLTETAAYHIEKSNGLGRAVNYNKLPAILYEEILPAWGIDVTEEEIQNIQEISGHYSKGRGNQAKEWKDDTKKKEEMATPEIQDASRVFLQSSFDRLEELAKAA